jgi:hypothetical protein
METNQNLRTRTLCIRRLQIQTLRNVFFHAGLFIEIMNNNSRGIVILIRSKKGNVAIGGQKVLNKSEFEPKYLHSCL